MLVQIIPANRNRPMRSGKVNEFAGLLFCMECGAKMYLTRKSGDDSGNQDRYACSTYRNHRQEKKCTCYSIKKSIV
jgi:hypothetical protein